MLQKTGKSKKKAPPKKKKHPKYIGPPEVWPPYIPRMWKGVKKVFKCEHCDHYEDVEDDMQLHVLKHYPANKRSDILDKLVR